jgi:hypothetical protein
LLRVEATWYVCGVRFDDGSLNFSRIGVYKEKPDALAMQRELQAPAQAAAQAATPE